MNVMALIVTGCLGNTLISKRYFCWHVGRLMPDIGHSFTTVSTGGWSNFYSEGTRSDLQSRTVMVNRSKVKSKGCLYTSELRVIKYQD